MGDCCNQKDNSEEDCSPCGKFGCDYDFIKPGPPCDLPGWFKCPPEINDKMYPVPNGVTILKISEGGRNGSSKKKFKGCGTCTEPKPKPTDTKPKIDCGCPMSKTSMKGLGCCKDEEKKEDGKPPSFMDKCKAFFAGKKDKDGGKEGKEGAKEGKEGKKE